MKLYAKCITPIHIGSGNVLEPFDYAFYREKLIIINQKKCLERIYEKHPGAIEKYSKWVNKVSSEISNAKKKVREARQNRDFKNSKNHNQLISDLRGNFNLFAFCNDHLNDSEIIDEFYNNAVYHKRSMFTLSKPAGTFQVREIIHQGLSPYIPGSSIKGAIRTALAFSSVKNLSGEWLNILINGKKGTNIQGIANALETIRKLATEAEKAIEKGNFNAAINAFDLLKKEQNRWNRKIGNEVEKVIFGCGLETSKGIKYDDPKFDLMRIVKITDSLEANFELMGGHLMSFTKNWDTGEIKSQPVQFCEVIDEESTFSFDLNVDTNLIKAVLSSNSNKGWKDFEAKFKHLFSIDAGLPNEELNEQMINHIKDSIKDFSRAIIKKENQWLSKFREGDVRRINEYYKRMNHDNICMRLGFSSGWHSTSMGLALMENTNLTQYLPELIYAFNMDLIIKQKNLLKRAERNEMKSAKQLKLLRRKINSENFPGSRRLLSQHRKPYSPLGWLEILEKPFLKKQLESQEKKLNKDEADNDDISFEEKLKKLKQKFS